MVEACVELDGGALIEIIWMLVQLFALIINFIDRQR